MASSLDSLRNKLDGIDSNIVDALAKRERLIEDIIKLKAEVESGPQLRDRQREQQILARLAAKATEAGINGDYVTRLYQEILDHSVRRQQTGVKSGDNGDDAPTEKRPIIVAYQGTDGSYSHQAATRHFSTREGVTAYRGMHTFRNVIDAVNAGSADYGVLPIENTTAGSINETYDLISRTDLSLVGEEVQKIDHCVMAIEPVSLADITHIYSQAQALAQCTDFLDALDHVSAVSWTDTAMSCTKIIEDGDPKQAAIASEEAARRYHLHVVKRDIANQHANFTRFWVVAKEAAEYDLRVACKTSLIMAVGHTDGALLECLDVLAGRHLNLCKLESRPRPNAPWQYMFYVDIEGNLKDHNVREAVEELKAHTEYLKVLGSYPARTTAAAKPTERPRKTRHVATRARHRSSPPALSGDLRQELASKPYRLASRLNRAEDTIIRVGATRIGGGSPVVMAGPCSVESWEQVLSCAKAVKAEGGDILRGGCFKPRTHPYSFQGLGWEALDMLYEAGREVGLPIITEVMRPEHTEAIADKADILQIGARNMQNFDLLREVGRVDRPVMLKRGLSATIDDWLSAAEYILKEGNQQVVLCERGIRTFSKTTRNTLDISSVPVVRERSHLPIIVDPSHACGVRRWIPALTRSALAVGADGVMVEIHPNPEVAKSDGPQALTFAMWKAMMGDLEFGHA